MIIVLNWWLTVSFWSLVCVRVYDSVVYIPTYTPPAQRSSIQKYFSVRLCGFFPISKYFWVEWRRQKEDESISLFIDGKDRRGGPIFSLFWTNATGSVNRRRCEFFQLLFVGELHLPSLCLKFQIYLNLKLLLLSSSIVGRCDVRRSVGRNTRNVRDDNFQTNRWRYGNLCWPL